MRWLTYISPTDGREHAGVVLGDEIHGRAVADPLVDLLARGNDALAREALTVQANPLEVVHQDQVEICAPVPRPPSIRDFMAFESHLVTAMAALGRQVEPVWYDFPLFYFSNPAAVKGAFESVEIFPGSVQFDYELEVAAVVGLAGSDIKPENAINHIAGYVLFCDWSARDLQNRAMPQGMGPVKGKDGANSFGPWLLTPDELEDRRRGCSHDLEMTATVNGQRYSTGNLADLHWTFEDMVCYASRGTTLLPGDILGSGTVGTGCILELSLVHGEGSYPWLRPGDQVTLEVERLGAVRAEIRAARDEVPLREGREKVSIDRR